MKKRNHKIRKKRAVPYVIDCLQLPPDAAVETETIMMQGNAALKVCCIKQIESIEPQCICIKTKRHRILISGEGLYLEYFTKDALYVKGIIDQVKYQSIWS